MYQRFISTVAPPWFAEASMASMMRMSRSPIPPGPEDSQVNGTFSSVSEPVTGL